MYIVVNKYLLDNNFKRSQGSFVYPKLHIVVHNVMAMNVYSSYIKVP